MLKLHVELIRHFCADVEIVVSDDGSSQDVFQFIQKLPIDHIFRPKRKRGQHTASQTIQHGVNLCTRDYYLFAEDDFLYTANFLPHHRWIRKPKIAREGGMVVPDVQFSTPINILEQCITKLENEDFHLVQLAKRCGKAGSIVDGQIQQWDHTSSRPNNWPWMCKTGFRRQMKLPNFMNIGTTESWISHYLVNRYRPLKMCRLPKPCFVHAGNLFTVNY
ncbi:MAG TPA: glycosyltransferase, partial [bacterium]|nr:glycosyltransferase [bacterium]